MVPRKLNGRRGALSADDVCNASRPAFTLIELLLALVLLDIGLLALVALGAAITRDASTVRALASANHSASMRLERMASVDCTGASSGASNPFPGAADWFTDAPAPNGTRILTDSVVVTLPRGGHSTTVLHTRAPC